MPVLHAAVTDGLVDFCVRVINDLGLPGIFVLMTAESACIPIPSEATMLFAGFNVSDGHYSLVAITAVGVAGNLIGSWIAYAVGYFGRIDLLEKHGAKLHVRPKDLARADDWFARYGTWAVFFSRLLPVVRTFISLPAGAARMPFGRFTALTVAGCVPWVLMLGIVGDQVGDKWKDWKNHLQFLDYVGAAILIAAVVVLVVRWRRGTPATV